MGQMSPNHITAANRYISMAMQKQSDSVGESIEANSNCSHQHKEDILGSPEYIREWEEARCPVCLEHPHNAVLLRCSSYGNGCRPFICNTSSHHSNCLDQFRKSHEPSPSSFLMPGIIEIQTDAADGESEYMLTCPLCRGPVYGWFVIEPARAFMNSKTRSCSTETCKFIGNYMELRKHARSDHPSVRPSAVDPERQRNWTRMENETHLSNLLSMLPSIDLGLDGHEGGETMIFDNEGGETLIFDNEEEETLIFDEIASEVDNINIGFVADNNVEMLDDILCFDSTITYMTSQRNYSRDDRNGSLPPNDERYNYSGRNENYISRPNNSFRERYDRFNNINNPRRYNSMRGRIPRNNRDVSRYNNVNNNMNLRQNNRFRGSNSVRMRDTRPNNANTRGDMSR